MRNRVAVAGLAALTSLLIWKGRADESAAQPFLVDWRAGRVSPADLSHLLSAPAGADGFVRSANGHFVSPDGQRIRFWGVNLTMQAGLPPKENAPVLAAHLARLGVNCVRFHFLDRPAPTGLIVSESDDTRALDPLQLGRLDFFIAELKRRGIYTDLNLNVGRTYKAGDGVRDPDLLGFAKSLTYFDPRLIELQKEYARQLLTHRNPYTRSEYRNEPAVALIEFVNENSLVEAWFNGRLLGQHTTKNPGTWTDIPASYAQALTEKFNGWLKTRYPDDTLARWKREAGVPEAGPVPRLKPSEFNHASADRFHAEAAFYMDVERDFFSEMRRYLREELGVKSLLAGNSDHGHYRTGYPQLVGTALLDVVDSHVYWQHPRYLTDARSGKRSGFEIPNTPMVNEPLQSTVVQLSRSAVAGRPFTVSEVNHPFPNEYAAEGIPILAAYAALHDWDGIFWYTLAHRDVISAEAKMGGHFDLAPDPVKVSQLAAGALLFLRGDVQPARRTIERSYTIEQVRESIRLPASERPYFTPGFPLNLVLRHAVRIRSFEGPGTQAFDSAGAFPIQSDTGELTWFLGSESKGLVVINTPRWQSRVGFSGIEHSPADHLVIEVTNLFSAITLSALDDSPIHEASKLLLTTGARVANSNMAWNERRTTLLDWGQAPTVIEPVVGHVQLRNLKGATRVMAQALNGAGLLFGPQRFAERSEAGWRLAVGEPATTWYLVTVDRY